MDLRTLHKGGSPAIGRRITANTSLTTADRSATVLADTTTGPISITLPGSPSVGDSYRLQDAMGTWSTNAVTLVSNKFFGTTQDILLNITYSCVNITYNGAATGWTLLPEDISIDNTALNALFSAKANTVDVAAMAAALAPLASPALTGTPTAPTAPAGTNSTQLATTAYADAAVAALSAVASPIGASGTITVANRWKTTPVNTATGAISLTLPAGTVGDTYTFVDAAATWGTNNLTLVLGIFHSKSTPLVLNTSYGTATIRYVNATVGWVLV